MNDFFEQFKKQEEINEGLFDKVFKNPFKKKGQQAQVVQSGQTQPNGPEIIENTDNTISIKFENGSFAKEVNTIAALPFLKSMDFNAGNFNFLNLPGTKFIANYLELDLKAQRVKIFMGEWSSGPFNGDHFEGKFNGSSFQGNFVGKYTDWEAHPTKFVDGTFLDTTESGLLGIPNMVTMPAKIGEDTHLIFIPVGHYLQFRSKNGITGHIKVLKRLDAANSDFQYEVLNGFKSQSPNILNLSWTQIRQSWNNLFVDPKNTKNLAGIIQVPDGDEIVESYISAAPATFKAPGLEFNPKSLYKFTLSKIPYLSIHTIKGAGGKFTKPEVYLKFDSNQEFDKYEEIASYIDSGTFKQDVKDINKAIKYGEIDGYGPYNYLKFIFNDIQGAKLMPVKTGTRKSSLAEAGGVLDTVKFKAPTFNRYSSVPTQQQQELQYGPVPAMERMNDFIKFFVENIVEKSGKPNLPIQNLIISRLKTALGTDSMQNQPIKPVSKTVTPVVEPGAQAQDIDLKSARMSPKNESVRISVRNIINDNF